jgi:hypothetical protein
MSASSAFVVLWGGWGGQVVDLSMPSTGSPPSGFKRQSVGHGRASAIVATETTRAVEDGVGAVVVLTNLDPRLDKVRAQRTCRNLQFQQVERDAIVVADLTLLLHAKDLAEIDTRHRDESAAVLLRLDGKAALWAGR